MPVSVLVTAKWPAYQQTTEQFTPISVNFQSACPRYANIGGIQTEENKSIKAQYPKSIERKREVKES